MNEISIFTLANNINSIVEVLRAKWIFGKKFQRCFVSQCYHEDIYALKGEKKAMHWLLIVGILKWIFGGFWLFWNKVKIKKLSFACEEKFTVHSWYLYEGKRLQVSSKDSGFFNHGTSDNLSWVNFVCVGGFCSVLGLYPVDTGLPNMVTMKNVPRQLSNNSLWGQTSGGGSEPVI